MQTRRLLFGEALTLTLSSNDTTNGSSVRIVKWRTSIVDRGGQSSSTETRTEIHII